MSKDRSSFKRAFEQVLSKHVSEVEYDLKSYLVGLRYADLSKKEATLLASACSKVVYLIYKTLFASVFQKRKYVLNDLVERLNKWTACKSDFLLGGVYYGLAHVLLLALRQGYEVGRVVAYLKDLEGKDELKVIDDVAKGHVNACARVFSSFFKKLASGKPNLENYDFLLRTFRDCLNLICKKEEEERDDLRFSLNVVERFLEYYAAFVKNLESSTESLLKAFNVYGNALTWGMEFCYKLAELSYEPSEDSSNVGVVNAFFQALRKVLESTSTLPFTGNDKWNAVLILCVLELLNVRGVVASALEKEVSEKEENFDVSVDEEVLTKVLTNALMDVLKRPPSYYSEELTKDLIDVLDKTYANGKGVDCRLFEVYKVTALCALFKAKSTAPDVFKLGRGFDVRFLEKANEVVANGFEDLKREKEVALENALARLYEGFKSACVEVIREVANELKEQVRKDFGLPYRRVL